jgi:hypothetical protein
VALEQRERDGAGLPVCRVTVGGDGGEADADLTLVRGRVEREGRELDDALALGDVGESQDSSITALPFSKGMTDGPL